MSTRESIAWARRSSRRPASCARSSTAHARPGRLCGSARCAYVPPPKPAGTHQYRQSLQSQRENAPMKSILTLAVSAALLSACAATGPETAWGKPGISKVDYVTDLGTCTAMSAMAETGNGANTAGGMNGKNNSAPATNGGDAAKAGGQSGGSSAGAAVPM